MVSIKVLVIDDSAFYRQSIAEMLKTDSRFEVVGTVGNGSDAIQILNRVQPDVITLDLEMAHMDGFTLLRWLLVNNPIPVVVISSKSEAHNILKALELGAVDFLVKPTHRASLEILKLQVELTSKIETAAGVSRERLIGLYSEARKQDGKKEVLSEGRPTENGIHLVAIGSSTGGPPAVQSIIKKLPKDFPAAVVVSQHMPPDFTKYFAERLDKNADVPVKEARAGDILEAGKVYIAPGAKHMLFRNQKFGIEILLKARVESDKYSPSIDQMMTSAAEAYGPGVLGVILTGMGDDGTYGMKAIKDRGGTTFVESEETSVVFGMPRETINMGVVDKIIPLHKIPDELLHRCYGS